MRSAEHLYRVPYDRARAEYTYDEIARELGISITRVQQLENDALTKCFFWCQKHGYRLEDLIDRRRPKR